MLRSGVSVCLFAVIIAASGACGSDGDAQQGDDEVRASAPVPTTPEVRAAADACSAAIDAIPPDAWHAEGHVDRAHDPAISHAARVCLSSYIQLRTVNPAGPGDVGEIAAAGFFQRIFEHLGVPTQTAPLAGAPDPNRVSLIATLRGRSREGSVLLLNHSDVVPATGNWTHPPFSGDDDGTFIWGRGALDMKSIGIMQMLSMAILKKSGVALEHDVHFAAVPDEEVGGRGAEFIALGRIKEDGTNEKVDPLGLHPGVVLNEGGTGIRDALLPGRDVFVLGTEEKGVVWTQLAHASPVTLIRSIARTSVLTAPKSDGTASSADRDALAAKCKVAAMISDESQKTNVQPRLSKVTLDCDAGSEATVRRALTPLPKSFTTAPKVTIGSTPKNGRESIEVAIEMGSGGHGSASVGATALDVAVAVLISTGQLERNALTADSGVEDRFFPLGLSPAMKSAFGVLARSQGETAQSITDWLTSKPGVTGMLLGLADGVLPTDAIFKNTCNWTAFKFPADGEARAKLDCRITFDTKAAAFEQGLAGVVAADGVKLRTDSAACFDCYKQEFNASPTDTPQYKVIAQTVERSTPNAIASPYLFPGSSDTFFFRRAGVLTYGFMPSAVGEAELRTFHAIDERIPVAVLAPSMHVYAEIVERLANGRPASATTTDKKLRGQNLSCRRRTGSGSSFRWGDVEDLVQCEGSLYLCTRGAGAPRFISGVPDENDAELSVLARMNAGYDPNGTDPTELPSAVESRLFEPRGDDVRVFAGQPFEVDTGEGASRSFLVQCTTPLHQRLATFFTRSKVSFFPE